MNRWLQARRLEKVAQNRFLVTRALWYLIVFFACGLAILNSEHWLPICGVSIVLILIVSYFIQTKFIESSRATHIAAVNSGYIPYLSSNDQHRMGLLLSFLSRLGEDTLPEATSNSVYLAYRPVWGDSLANYVAHDLKEHGITVVMSQPEHDETELLKHPYYLLIVTIGTLIDCQEEIDFLRQQIRFALLSQRTIIPLFTPDFEFSDYDLFLPSEIAYELKRANGLEVPFRHFDYVMRDLRETFLQPVRFKALESLPEESEKPLAAWNAQMALLRFFAASDSDISMQKNHLEAALKWDEKYISAHHARSDLAFILAQYPNALTDINYVIAQDEKNTFALLHRSRVHFAMQNYEAAIQDLKKYLFMVPNHAPALYLLAQAKKETADYNGAEQELNAYRKQFTTPETLQRVDAELAEIKTLRKQKKKQPRG